MDSFSYINLSDIYPNPYQPRQHFKPEELTELTESIKENGLIQPIIVRESPIFGYELIAGERRLKASQLAGLAKIPAIIKTISDQDSMKQAIIENLQRSDLNPIEEAQAYQKILDKTKTTHDELAKSMGKSRPYISNSLRLLQLPAHLQKAVALDQLSQGHARLLINLKESEQLFYFNLIQEEGLSVRQLEKRLKTETKPTKTRTPDLFIQESEKELSRSLGLPVTLTYHKKHKGQLTIHFSSEEDYQRLINKLK
ncbi:ParB/RepB/Spo0J family partition protein [Streptococcus cuniculipharyngis]|uniref:ParB/RepB/Spo0J family partition protein n=1 Tax=Streptococcus cuniculipharyngis TaxID=1562651 RepID=A0A5C5SDE5_9STRE|nr:ParB/RepB/Spo0J family partition protein [Streptococcus cuniculipharyngis]TWS97706.1 ParB/RepB/Spo0J family partition protein [Streptococcus cuniculipharyngis]